MINKFSTLNFSKYFYSGILQNYLKYILNILVAQLELVCGNPMECQEIMLENITKSDSNFAPTFVDHNVLPDLHFNGHCLINNISISKK